MDKATNPSFYKNCTDANAEQYIETADWDDFEAEEREWNEITIGCRQCTKNSDATSEVYSIAEYND